MGIVVSRNDAGRNFDRLELRLARPNDGQIGALEKVLAPVGHDGDKPLGVQFHQCVAVLRSRFDAFFPVFHVTDLGHAALLGGFNELAVIFFVPAAHRQNVRRLHAKAVNPSLPPDVATQIRVQSGSRRNCRR